MLNPNKIVSIIYMILLVNAIPGSLFLILLFLNICIDNYVNLYNNLIILFTSIYSKGDSPSIGGMKVTSKSFFYFINFICPIFMKAFY